MPPLIGVGVYRQAAEKYPAVEATEAVGNYLAAGRIYDTAVRQKPDFRAFADRKKTGNVVISADLINRIQSGIARNAWIKYFRLTYREVPGDGLQGLSGKRAGENRKAQ